MRRYTVKVLNEIKGMSDYVNIHMNTIIDSAIRYYYEFLKKNRQNSNNN